MAALLVRAAISIFKRSFFYKKIKNQCFQSVFVKQRHFEMKSLVIIPIPKTPEVRFIGIEKW